MAQATYIQVGREIDYTPGNAVVAGQVVVQGNLAGIAKTAIAANTLGALSVSGIFDVVQAAEIIPAGSPVYWDADGNPVGGAEGTGAATATATGNTFMGFAQALTAAEDTTVRVALRSAETVAGGVATATSITGTASTFPIAGFSAATGGTVTVAGGASTGSNAGGSLTLTGGAGGANSAGGAVIVEGKAGTATNGAGGAVTIRGGLADGSGGNGIVTIGATNTASIAIGAAAITTAVAGPLTQRQAIVDATSDITLTAAQSGSLVLLNTSDLVKLPAVSGLTGVFYDFVAITVATTAPLIDPAGSEVITIGAAAQTGGEAIEPTAIGDSCRLVCTGTAWVSTHLNGTWAGAVD